MIGIVLALAAVGVSPTMSPEDTLVEETEVVCGSAIGPYEDAMAGVQQKDRWPLYVGRMETAMDQLNMSEDRRQIMRFLCRVYLRASINSTESVIKLFDEKTKSTQR
jgi:hypothetical protein